MFDTYFVIGLLALALAWAAGAGTGQECRQESATVSPVVRFQLSINGARSRLETAR